MTEILQTVVYRFEELADSAKAQARDWYRGGCCEDDWYDAVYQDFETVCAILGVRLQTRPVRLCGGGSRQAPCIYFSGFWSQGDGACFEASYSYAKGAEQKMRSHAPQDGELHRIAAALQAIQRRNFFQLHAVAHHRGRSCHDHSMSIAVDRESRGYQDMTADAEQAVAEALRDLARWLYRQLEREYEYLVSDEVVDDAIQANAYTFTIEGRRFG